MSLNINLGLVTQNSMCHISRDYYDDITDYIGYFFLGGWENKPFGANLTAFLIWLLSLVASRSVIKVSLCLIWPWWQCSLLLLSIINTPYCTCILCNMLHMCQRVFLNIWTIFEDLAFTAIHFPYPGSTSYLKKAVKCSVIRC